MSLRLDLSVENPRLSVYEGLRVGLALENLGQAAQELPEPDDESGSLSFLIYREDGTPFLAMNGLTSQAMTSTARIDRRVAREVLKPGGRWNWRADLSGWHYPLPAGRYLVEALLEDPAAGVHVRSPRLPVEAVDPGLTGLSVLRANPVIDGLSFLFHAVEGTAWIRQCNATRPLAAWYSRALPFPSVPIQVLSQPLFFRPESFDPFFRHWVVGSRDGRLEARMIESGEPAPTDMQATLPPGRALLPWAFHAFDGTLYVALSPALGAFEIHVWDADGLRLLFRHDLPGRPAFFCLGADENAVHTAYEDGGLACVSLDWAGRILVRRRQPLRGLKAQWIEFDAVDGAFFAFFRDGDHGKTCACVEADLDPQGDADAFTVRPLDLCLRGDVREVHFRRDKRRRPHVLIATAGGRLYYKCAAKALMRLADGQTAWYPRVSSAGRTHVGFYRKDMGFRFREVNQGRGRRLKDPG